MPEVIANERLQCHNRERILTYEGIKEDVYAHDFEPDESLHAKLGLDKQNIIVTVRPPASEAHYHNPESDELLASFMDMACTREDVQIILLPRNSSQEAHLRKKWPQWFTGGSVIIPEEAVDGLNLLWHSDLVVSGGGTMNREAAALGLPVYSIFRGPMGSLDKELQRQGRLTLVSNTSEVERKIAIEKYRDRESKKRPAARSPIASIIEHVDRIRERESMPKSKISPRGAQ